MQCNFTAFFKKKSLSIDLNLFCRWQIELEWRIKINKGRKWRYKGVIFYAFVSKNARHVFFKITCTCVSSARAYIINWELIYIQIEYVEFYFIYKDFLKMRVSYAVLYSNNWIQHVGVCLKMNNFVLF